MKKIIKKIDKTKAEKKDKLTEKLDKFSREYILFGNQSEAYRRSHNAEKMKPETVWSEASRVFKKPAVSARIKELKKNIEEILEINKVTILKDLLEIRDRSMQRIPVMKFNPKIKDFEQVVDDNGEGVWQYDSAGANSALDKIMKAMGYYAPTKQEFAGKDGETIKIENKTKIDISKLSTDELKSLQNVLTTINKNENN